MGGVKSAVEKLEITKACNFKATPEERQTLVFPYEEGKELDLIAEWKNIFTLDNGGDDGCVFNNIYRYSDEDKYPNYTDAIDELDSSKDTVISESDKGV
jgi:hypothetical protein